MVEIQARRGEEESRLFRSETAATIVSRRGRAAVGASEQHEGEGFPSLRALRVPTCQVKMSVGETGRSIDSPLL